MSITCQNLSVKLGGKLILEQITAEFKTHPFIGIIGPNGSGKSTLLKTIYRVLSPDAGTVYLGDKPIDDYSYKESAKAIGVVSQHNFYNFDFSVLEVVLMGRAPHKKYMQRDNLEDYKIVDDALKKVDMYNHKDRIFSTLSGGEQQRIILARALCQESPHLILDEPTNHLDIKHQLDILNLVKTLDIKVIAAIHDLNIALNYCDYLYMLKDGKIFEHGSPERVLTPQNIRHVYHVDSHILSDDILDRKIISFFK